MDAGLGAIIFLGLILKIPLFGACWLIYWAVKEEPEPAEAADEDTGHDFRRFRRSPKRPRDPRRGPHSPDALPLPCPEEGPAIRVIRRPAAATADARERHRSS